MINELELPYGGDVTHAGDRYRVVDASSPWGLPVGAQLEEVRRGEFWDSDIPKPIGPIGHCWVWLRPFVLGAPPELGFIGHLPPGERARPVLLEVVDESGVRTWTAAWLEAVPRS
jgi:hypothetical protein